MWRLIYNKYKLTLSEQQTLNRVLEEYTYTCGGKITDLALGGRFDQEFVAAVMSCWRSFITQWVTTKLFVFTVAATKT